MPEERIQSISKVLDVSLNPHIDFPDTFLVILIDKYDGQFSAFRIHGVQGPLEMATVVFTETPTRLATDILFKSLKRNWEAISLTIDCVMSFIFLPFLSLFDGVL